MDKIVTPTADQLAHVMSHAAFLLWRHISETLDLLITKTWTLPSACSQIELSCSLPGQALREHQLFLQLCPRAFLVPVSVQQQPTVTYREEPDQVINRPGFCSSTWL